MDWTASGITNTFRYEMLDPWCHDSRGDLEVYSCSISEGYYTDAKAQADFEVSGNSYVENSAIRVWHSATLGEETITECIGTFIPDTQSETLKYGSSVLTLAMMHPLDKLATDYRNGDFSVDAGRNIADFVKDRIEGSGADANISPALVASNKGFSSAWIWEHGDSVLSAINKAADACNYRVGADEFGAVTFYPYVVPSARDIAYTFPTGALSITMPEVKISTNEIVNCVNVKATKDETTLTARATVAATHPWHFTRIGRWYGKTYEESQMDDFSQEAVNKKAKQYLAENDNTTRKWEATCLYVPIKCGDVVMFDTGDGTQVKAMVQQRKITCDKTMQMELILDEVI